MCSNLEKSLFCINFGIVNIHKMCETLRKNMNYLKIIFLHGEIFEFL
jgi:hypothetical protein